MAFDPANPTATTPIGSLGTVADITLSVSGTAASGFAIPQALSGASLVFVVDDCGTFAMPITTTNLLSGSNHNYTVTISRTGVTLTGSTIDGWNNDTDTSDNEGTAVMVAWDGTTIATAFESGTGSDTDPFIIANGEQLAYLAQQVNTGTTYSSTYFKLASNINLNDKEWTPIGTLDNPFKGSFDGNSKIVSNMSITTGDANASYSVGLFGCVDGGSLMNITVNGTINLPQHKSGDKYIGAVVGYLKSGNVDGISATVTMTLSSDGWSTGEMHVGGAIGKTDIELSSNIFSITPTITFKMDCAEETSRTGLRTVGHNVGWCIDSEKTQSANSPYTKDDSALILDVGMNVSFNDVIGYSNGYSLY